MKTINGGGARSYTITGLQKDSYYEVRLTAINDIGESDVEIRIIRTGKGGESFFVNLVLSFLKKIQQILT